MIDAGLLGGRAGGRVHAVTVLPITLATLRVGAVAADDTFAEASGARDPLDVVTVSRHPLRATTPSNVGDSNAGTNTSDLWSSGAHSGTLVVEATAFEDFASGEAIEGVELFALASIDDTGTPPLHPPAENTTRMKVTTGGNTTTVALGDPPFVAPSSAVRDTDQFRVRSGVLTTKPGGGPWTRADVNAISSVKLEQDFTTGAAENMRLVVAEFWLEVYAKVGSAPVTVEVRQRIGDVVRVQQLIR
jgi:hypothetical protein